MKKLLMAMVMICLFASQAYSGNLRGEIYWTQEIQPNLAGWKLYVSTESGVYDTAFADIPFVSEQTEYSTSQVITVPSGTAKVYAVITAYDTTGKETARSNEASADVPLSKPFILRFGTETE